MTDHPDAALSGRVFLSAEIQEVEVQAGDVKIYAQQDYTGRRAVRGGHTNFGYSGYFCASLFDGTGWRRFNTKDFLTREEVSYATQGEKPKAKSRVTKLLEQRGGQVASWDTEASQYRLTVL